MSTRNLQRIKTYKKFTILKINFIIYYQLWLALYFNLRYTFKFNCLFIYTWSLL